MARIGFSSAGNMTKKVYDPDKDGLIALAQLVSAVCSETEALALIAAVAPFKYIKVSARTYMVPGWGFSAGSTDALTTGRILFIPIYIAETFTFDRIAIDVTVAGAGGTKARLGIYNYSDGLPTSLVLDAGTVAVDSTGDKELTIDQELTPGYYFLALVCDGAPTVRIPDGTEYISSPVTGGSAVIGFTVVASCLRKEGESGQVDGGLTDPAVTTLSDTGVEAICVLLGK